MRQIFEYTNLTSLTSFGEHRTIGIWCALIRVVVDISLFTAYNIADNWVFWKGWSSNGSNWYVSLRAHMLVVHVCSNQVCTPDTLHLNCYQLCGMQSWTPASSHHTTCI